MHAQTNDASPEIPVDSPASSDNPRHRGLRLRLLILLAITIVCAIIFLPIQDIFRALQEWARGLGTWACLVYVVATALLIPLFIPVTALSLTAGSIFGLPLGVAVMSTGATLGASLSFLISRHLARGVVEDRVAGKPIFKVLDKAVTREGFKIVLLSRLSPVFPYKLLNYAYGLTSIPFRTYLLATWLGSIPGACFYVYLGMTTVDVAHAVTDEHRGGDTILWLKIGGLIVTILITWIITRVARKAMKEAIAEGPNL